MKPLPDPARLSAADYAARVDAARSRAVVLRQQAIDACWSAVTRRLRAAFAPPRGGRALSPRSAARP